MDKSDRDSNSQTQALRVFPTIDVSREYLKKCGKRKVSLSRIQSLIMYSLFGFLRESNQIELSGTETGRSGIMVIDLVCGYIHIQYNSYIKPTIPSLTIVWKLPTLV